MFSGLMSLWCGHANTQYRKDESTGKTRYAKELAHQMKRVSMERESTHQDGEPK